MKYQKWYDSLPPHTKTWLNNQPVWHERDLYKAAAIGLLIGFIIGILL